MNRLRLLFILGFVLSMGAGVVVGVVGTVVRRTPKVQVEQRSTSRPNWDADLGLDAKQAEQVDAIWSSVRSAMRQLDDNRGDKRRTLNHERDEAIAQLIPTDHKADYDRIMQDYSTKVAELGKDRDKLFQDAEQKMKLLLTESQWRRFEAIKKERSDHGRNGRPQNGHGGPHPPPPTRPSSEK